MEITLTKVVIGLGNSQHEHVHRHNILNLNDMHIDQLTTEQRAGGILESTLNTLSGQAGGLSVQPRGFVGIEDTFNQRRGLCMLKFFTSESALRTTELVILGYLVGGEPRDDGGIDPATRFYPVRCWEVDTSNKTDFNGMPTVQQAILNSQQFLQGHPDPNVKQRSMRPLDVGNEILGYAATEQENGQNDYSGNVLADLNKGIIVSKTQNLDTTHYAKQLMKIAGNTLIDSDYGTSITESVGNSIYSGGMGEASVNKNPFFVAMSIGGAHWSGAGFNGFSLGEIANTFDNFTQVLNLDMIYANTDEIDVIGTTSGYGATSITETTAQEIAALCADLAVRCGLTFCVFSATNNPDSFGGFMQDDGVAIFNGEWMSIIDEDPYSVNRLERFKQMFKDRFYTKHDTGYIHTSTLISIQVTCVLFGETSVRLFFNGDESTAQTYSNATYYLSRTSTNIAGTEVGINESVRFLENIREHFVS